MLFNNQAQLLSSACPFPLVVPDDPSAPILFPGVPCQQRCEGHLFTEGELQQVFLIFKIASIFSVLGSGFNLVTWLFFFKAKRDQPLPHYYSPDALS